MIGKAGLLSTGGGKAAATGAAVLLLGGSLAGRAHLTASGSESGTGAAATAQAKPTPSCAGSSQGDDCKGGNGDKSFAIGGAVTALLPGLDRTMTLTLKNGNAQSIKVLTLTVRATGVAGCAASFLGLGTGYSPGQGSISPSDLVVPGRATVTTPFPVKLLGSAPDSCKEVTFTLAYSGTAAQA